VLLAALSESLDFVADRIQQQLSTLAGAQQQHGSKDPRHSSAATATPPGRSAAAAAAAITSSPGLQPPRHGSCGSRGGVGGSRGGAGGGANASLMETLAVTQDRWVWLWFVVVFWEWMALYDFCLDA